MSLFQVVRLELGLVLYPVLVSWFRGLGRLSQTLVPAYHYELVTWVVNDLCSREANSNWSVDARWSGLWTAGWLCCLGYAYTCTPYLVSDVWGTTVWAFGRRSQCRKSKINIPGGVVFVQNNQILFVFTVSARLNGPTLLLSHPCVGEFTVGYTPQFPCVGHCNECV